MSIAEIPAAAETPFEKQVRHIRGPVGELLRAIARADSDYRQHVHGPSAEGWRWSATVVKAKKLARELSEGTR